jgi:hypothetical protein
MVVNSQKMKQIRRGLRRRRFISKAVSRVAKEAGGEATTTSNLFGESHAQEEKLTVRCPCVNQE